MNATTTHTPGPWMLGENTPSELDQPIVANASDGTRVVRVAVVDLDEADEAEANARLIAAAPELAGAVRDLLPWIGKALADGAFAGCAAPNGADAAMKRAESALRSAGLID